MSHIRVLICRVDEPTSDTLTELTAFDLVMPGNAILPDHHGMIITRGLHLLGLFTATRIAVCLGGAPVGLAGAGGTDPL